MEKKHLRFGAVAGRHNIPHIERYLFEKVDDVFDFEHMRSVIFENLKDADSVDLYVTGLTVVVAEVIAFCAKNGIELTLWHYDREAELYRPQVVVSDREAWEIRETKWETYGL